MLIYTVEVLPSKTCHAGKVALQFREVENGVLTNVFVKLSHEGLAEACDLSIGSSLGVEVRASLSSSHGECGQAVLEHLLKTQELDDAQTHTGSKSQTALQAA